MAFQLRHVLNYIIMGTDDKTKAKDIGKKYKLYGMRPEDAAYAGAMDMADWKNEQIKEFIDKSVKWWRNNPDDSYGFNPVTCYLKQYKEWADKEMGIQRKLTYYQICNLAAQGRFDEIPSEYTIEWIGNEPCEVFDFETEGECVCFSNGNFAVPDKIHVSGVYMVDVPQPVYDEFGNIELVEYGPVAIKTYFVLSEIKFIYTETESRIEAYKYAKKCMGIDGEPVRKSDIAFDANIKFNGNNLSIYRMMMTQYDSNENKIVANFIYDHFLIS